MRSKWLRHKTVGFLLQLLSLDWSLSWLQQVLPAAVHPAGASSAIISTSYSSTDEDIYAAENAYRALEEALNMQINQMESTHPDYDEYRYQIDEIGHNPYQLISYLTVKYGGFTYDEVAEEIESIFRQQYGITTDSTRRQLPKQRQSG